MEKQGLLKTEKTTTRLKISTSAAVVLASLASTPVFAQGAVAPSSTSTQPTTTAAGTATYRSGPKSLEKTSLPTPPAALASPITPTSLFDRQT